MKTQVSQKARERAAHLLGARREQIFTLPRVPEDATSLELVFTPAWGRMDPDRVVAPQGFAVAEARSASVLRLDVTPGAPPSEIRVPVIGEPLDLVKFLFFDRFGSIIRALMRPLGTCSADPDLFETVPNGSPVAQGFDLGTHISAIDDLLNSAGDSAANSYRRFFAEMNKATHPDFLDVGISNGDIDGGTAGDVKSKVDWLITELGARLFDRAYEFSKGVSCPITYDLDPLHKGKVETLSKILLDLAKAHLADAAGEVDPARFAEAFECFANGQLRFQVPSGLWTTQPSSGYFFFFAEFAMLAIDVGVDADTWRQLAGSMIRTQEVFARVYPPVDAQPVYNSYRSCDYDPLQVYVPSELLTLATNNPLNDGTSRCQKAAQNALDYLPGLFP